MLCLQLCETLNEKNTFHPSIHHSSLTLSTVDSQTYFDDSMIDVNVDDLLDVVSSPLPDSLCCHDHPGLVCTSQILLNLRKY